MRIQHHTEDTETDNALKTWDLVKPEDHPTTEFLIPNTSNSSIDLKNEEHDTETKISGNIDQSEDNSVNIKPLICTDTTVSCAEQYAVPEPLAVIGNHARIITPEPVSVLNEQEIHGTVVLNQHDTAAITYPQDTMRSRNSAVSQGNNMVTPGTLCSDPIACSSKGDTLNTIENNMKDGGATLHNDIINILPLVGSTIVSNQKESMLGLAQGGRTHQDTVDNSTPANKRRLPISQMIVTPDLPLTATGKILSPKEGSTPVSPGGLGVVQAESFDSVPTKKQKLAFSQVRILFNI